MKNEVITKFVKANIAIKNGVDAEWLKDFGYTARVNSNGLFDLIDEGGEITENGAIALKHKCKICGGWNYEIEMGEADPTEQWYECRYCKQTIKVIDIA